MTWALKNIGLLCVAAALCCVCATIDGWRKELHHNTQIVTENKCQISGLETLAAAIDENQLKPMWRKK